LTRNSARNAARPWKRRSESPGLGFLWYRTVDPSVQPVPRQQHGTSTFRKRHPNIPRGHADLQGTTVNQATITIAQASHTATIRQTSPSSSLLPKAVHGITHELGVTFQIDRTSMLSTRSRETQICSSTPINRTPDSIAQHRPKTLITATRNPVPVELRKHPKTVPSPTLSLPSTVIRIWRIDR
jgi:hypothetical protein